MRTLEPGIVRDVVAVDLIAAVRRGRAGVVAHGVAGGVCRELEPVDVCAVVAAGGVRQRELHALALVRANDERLDGVAALQADRDLAVLLLLAYVADPVV